MPSLIADVSAIIQFDTFKLVKLKLARQLMFTCAKVQTIWYIVLYQVMHPSDPPIFEHLLDFLKCEHHKELPKDHDMPYHWYQDVQQNVNAHKILTYWVKMSIAHES